LKKILVLTYHFPPCAFGCCIRVFNFVKFLPDNSYEPVVLSVLPEYYKDYASNDDTHLRELPSSLELIRTKSFEPASKLRPGFKAESAEPQKDKTLPTKNLFAGFVRFLEQYVILPDVQSLCVPHTVKEGYKYIKENPETSVIYAAAPPFSVLISAIIIKKLTGKPLVVDFKDMWVGRNQHENKSIVCRIFSRFMERKIVSIADKVLLNTKSSIQNFRERYSGEPHEKFCIIPNGYDPKAEKYIDSKQTSEELAVFHIVHSGVIDTDRNPECFIEALGELAEENPAFRKKLVVSFAGKFHSSYLEIVKNLGLEKNFKYCGYLGYEENMKFLSKATVLLLITTLDAPDAIPGKLYEYFLFSKPILAMIEEGATKELLLEEKVGLIASHQDKEHIKKSIRELFSLFEEGRISEVPIVKEPERYSRKAQTKELADIFDNTQSSV